MAARIPRLLAAPTALAALLGVVPLDAAAQTASFYTPPKLVKMGQHSSPTPAKGAVTVKVFVKKNASVGSATVVKSSAHADDQAALEIAKSSVYKPGARDGKTGDFFYTISLKFDGSSVSAGDGAGGASAGLGQAAALIRANKYADAKAQLGIYLTAHPADKDAEALLGVADAFLNDNAGAAAAFDGAGTVPDRFKVVAAKAYGDAALDALKAKSNDAAIALATKSMALQPNVNTLFIRGTAYANSQQYSLAIADYERAKALAGSGKADAATINTIDTSLATAYVLGGQPDKGLALAQELKKRDPSNTRVDDTLNAYYNQQAAAAIAAGKKDDAVAALESGARAVPSRAVVLYSQAANLLAQGTTPDWKRVKGEADKALAADPNDAHANYIAGIALANSGDKAGATTYLQKAKANAGSDAKFTSDINDALTKLGVKPQ